ncbi:MAG: hypothetical protein H7331_11815 [Bacteroidia bacterium]|nr:hypothetical protein [Bacteroidia bacterium]
MEHLREQRAEKIKTLLPKELRGKTTTSGNPPAGSPESSERKATVTITPISL